MRGLDRDATLDSRFLVGPTERRPSTAPSSLDNSCRQMAFLMTVMPMMALPWGMLILHTRQETLSGDISPEPGLGEGRFRGI